MTIFTSDALFFEKLPSVDHAARFRVIEGAIQ
jgi:hypothetical protein